MQGASLYFKLTFLMRFIRKATYFKHNMYIKLNVCLSKNTYVFEPSFSDISFTGWFEFSFIFSAFSGLTAFISGIWYFFYFFIFLFIKSWPNEYTWVAFILMEASYGPWKEVGTPASQRELQPFVWIKLFYWLQNYEINPRVFIWPWLIK